MLEARKFALRIVKMFGYFAADDKVIVDFERFGVWDEKGIVGGHGVTHFT